MMGILVTSDNLARIFCRDMFNLKQIRHAADESQYRFFPNALPNCSQRFMANTQRSLPLLQVFEMNIRGKGRNGEVPSVPVVAFAIKDLMMRQLSSHRAVFVTRKSTKADFPWRVPRVIAPAFWTDAFLQCQAARPTRAHLSTCVISLSPPGRFWDRMGSSPAKIAFLCTTEVVTDFIMKQRSSLEYEHWAICLLIH